MTSGRLTATTRRPAPAVRVLPQVWLGLLIVAGLLLMHGIGLHGTSAEQHTGWQGSVVAGSAADAAQPARLAPVEPAAQHGQHESSDEAGSGMGPAMACVVMLLLAAIVLRAPQGRLVQLVTEHAAALRGWRAAVIAAPARPPSLTALCISRS